MIKLRISLIIISVFSILTFSFGQLPNGSIAPDFTLTDIEGKEHHLYSYLDAGKTVFLDFSATWCDPCWIYQNSNHLDKLYNLYGPDGTDEVRVLFIEGDPWTTFEDLAGSGPNTLGDWISNTDYPIIDDYSISNLYQIDYWPTIYKICPNKRIEEMGMAGASTLYACLDECEGPKGSHNAAIFSYNDDQGMFCDMKYIKPSITIQNEGNTMLQTCKIHFRNNNQTMQTIDWTGSVLPLQTTEVIFDTYVISEEANLEFEVELPNGQPDEDDDYNTLSDIRLWDPKSQRSLDLSIHTDFWPEEITWSILNDAGQILYQSSNFPPLEDTSLYNYSFVLPEDGCYSLEIQDSFGDGIVNGPVGGGLVAEGNISLTSEGINVWSGHNYGFGIDVNFEVSPFVTSVEEEILPKETFSLFPNPAVDKAQLSFSLQMNSGIAFSITDALGRVIQQIPGRQWASGDHLVPINLDRFAPGVYLILIQGERFNQSLKFVVGN